MTGAPTRDPAVLSRAARIRLACFDVDGTLTDGRIHFDAQGGETKSFHVHDGMGLALLRKAGIRVALVTARASAAVERRAKELQIEAHCAVADKLALVERIRSEMGIGMDEVSFMGDDLPDLRVMHAVGLAVAPGNAHPWTARDAHWSTVARGGEGAARELCDLLLGAQGLVDGLLEATIDGGGA